MAPENNQTFLQFIILHAEEIKIAISFVGVLSFIFAIYTFRKERKRKRIEKATEIAAYYAREIIPKLSYISIIMKISDCLHEVDKKDMKEFTREECINILGEDFIEEYLNKLRNFDLYTLLHARLFLYNVDVLWENEKIMNEILTVKPEESDAKKKKYETILQIREGPAIFVETLNNLEHIAMQLNKKIADKNVVYQSIHQTYFDTIELLYIFICEHNKSTSKDKFFTNIIKLYHDWMKIYLKKSKKENFWGNVGQYFIKKSKNSAEHAGPSA